MNIELVAPGVQEQRRRSRMHLFPAATTVALRGARNLKLTPWIYQSYRIPDSIAVLARTIIPPRDFSSPFCRFTDRTNLSLDPGDGVGLASFEQGRHIQSYRTVESAKQGWVWRMPTTAFNRLHATWGSQLPLYNFHIRQHASMRGSHRASFSALVCTRRQITRWVRNPQLP
ncbi:hypothetical protein BDV95DRAFT_155283 [Massariosphaeria phaeospora]|uniref:Uncharacterized protein n=1 Tax=Massariosphaeria phaeospora TaxID=100035 RepID=A0A7C8IEK7_9PLEO|nr:hypothetical protein BDV95DRAFT_155283 [Massariosphaeria phaeospora]